MLKQVPRSAYQPNALPLGQTGSLFVVVVVVSDDDDDDDDDDVDDDVDDDGRFHIALFSALGQTHGARM